MEIQIKQHKEDDMLVRCWKGFLPDQEVLSFIVPASAVPHEILCEIFKWGSVSFTNPKYISKVFDYHYDQVKLAKVMLENDFSKEHIQLTKMPFGKHKGVPFEDVNKNYFDWLVDTGRLDSPDNDELKKRLISLGLIEDVSAVQKGLDEAREGKITKNAIDLGEDEE